MENKTKKIQAGVFAAFLLLIAALPVTAIELRQDTNNLVMEKENMQPHYYSYDYDILWREDLHIAPISGGLRNAVDSQNNIIVTGVDLNQQGVLMKLNNDGNVIWDNSVIPKSDSIDLNQYLAMPLGGDPDEPETTYDMVERALPLLERSPDAQYLAMDVEIDSNDNIITSGVHFDDEWINGIAVLAKFDTNGNMLWNRSYNFLPPSSENYTWAFGITVDSNDNIYFPVFAIRDNASNAFICSFLLKITQNGHLLWISPRITAVYTDATVDLNDNPVICGMFYVSLPDPCNMMFTKFGKYTGIRYKETVVPVENNYATYPVSIKTDTNGYMYSCGVSEIYINGTLERKAFGIIASVDNNVNLLYKKLYGECMIIVDLAIRGNDIVLPTFEKWILFPHPDNYRGMIVSKTTGAVKLRLDLGPALPDGVLGADNYMKGVSIDHNGDAIFSGARGGIIVTKVDIIINTWMPPLHPTHIQMQQQYQ